MNTNLCYYCETPVPETGDDRLEILGPQNIGRWVCHPDCHHQSGNATLWLLRCAGYRIMGEWENGIVLALATNLAAAYQPVV